MEQVICTSCRKPIVFGGEKEPERSGDTGDFFCDFNCAVDWAVNRLEIVPVYADELPEDFKVVGGRLVRE